MLVPLTLPCQRRHEQQQDHCLSLKNPGMFVPHAKIALPPLLNNNTPLPTSPSKRHQHQGLLHTNKIRRAIGRLRGMPRMQYIIL